MERMWSCIIAIWLLGQVDFGGPDGKLFYYDGSRMNHGVRIRELIAWWQLAQLSPSVNARTNILYRLKMNYAYRGLKEGRIQWIFTYAARILENCNQALAFAVMKYHRFIN